MTHVCERTVLMGAYSLHEIMAAPFLHPRNLLRAGKRACLNTGEFERQASGRADGLCVLCVAAGLECAGDCSGEDDSGLGGRDGAARS